MSEQEPIPERSAWQEKLFLVGRALAGIVHEVKTPLNTIILTADDAREIAKSGKSNKEELEIIIRETERAAEILANFLEFTTPSEIELSPINLQDVLTTALDAMKIGSHESRIELRKELDAGVRVLGSRRHLIRAFTNILLNAIQAMPMGGTLTVSQVVAGDTVTTVISDAGRGISPEILAHLYESSYASRADSGGHGLGLSIARWIVEKHRGQIRVDSPGVGKGTRVEVSLPSLT